MQSAEEAVRICNEIGYPVMLKASMGGGGKGMRVVRDDSELETNMTLCQQEAEKFFGNPNVYAEKFLENAELVNDVRGVQGYTGLYKGVKVSVMASGMGIPSIGIYSYELFNGYDVENIMRIGSIGSINENVNLKDIIVATSASTNSNYGKNFHLDGIISAAASYKLLKKVDEASTKMGLESKVKFGQILSSDTFYTDEEENDLKWAKMGVIGVEMEGYALYLNAARAGKNALALCTVSDQLNRNEHLSPEERQLSFDEMLVLALETAVLLD